MTNDTSYVSYIYKHIDALELIQFHENHAIIYIHIFILKTASFKSATTINTLYIHLIFMSLEMYED